MSPDDVYLVVAALAVAGVVVAYLMRDRLGRFSIAWGTFWMKLKAHRRSPSISLEKVCAKNDVIAHDKSGAGISAKSINAGGSASFTSETPPKP